MNTQEIIKDNLETLWTSCAEALSDKWDRSDDGFHDMQILIERTAKELGIELDAPEKGCPVCSLGMNECQCPNDPLRGI